MSSMLFALVVGIFVREVDLEGLNKACVYSAAGSEVVITIPDWELCPVTIEV